QRDVAMRLGRHCDCHRVDAAVQLARVEQGRRAVRRGDLSRARLIDVDDRHELDARQGRQNARMVLAEVPDANDRDAHCRYPDHETTKTRRRPGSFFHRCDPRPTMQMPASSAALMIASPSIISVLPASTDSTVAPAAFIASIVATPTTGTSNRMS